jgi:hypothetical protein
MVSMVVGPSGFAQSTGTCIVPHWTFASSGQAFHSITGDDRARASTGGDAYGKIAVTTATAAARARTAISSDES